MLLRRMTIAGALCVAASSAPSAPPTPAAVLPLADWKLTIPYDTGRSGGPDEVLQPELGKFQDPRCFFTVEDHGGVHFRAACDGLGTENSRYPRAELREMTPGGEDEAHWSTDDKMPRELRATLAITHTPVRKPHVVCAQVHDDEDDLLMVRLEDDELFVERDSAEEVMLDPGYKLGSRFTLRLVAGDGRLKLWHNGRLKMDWEVSRDNCYYKFGCYTQSTRKQEKSDGAYGEVVAYALALKHDN